MNRQTKIVFSHLLFWLAAITMTTGASGCKSLNANSSLADATATPDMTVYVFGETEIDLDPDTPRPSAATTRASADTDAQATCHAVAGATAVWTEDSAGEQETEAETRGRTLLTHSVGGNCVPSDPPATVVQTASSTYEAWLRSDDGHNPETRGRYVEKVLVAGESLALPILQTWEDSGNGLLRAMAANVRSDPDWQLGAAPPSGPMTVLSFPFSKQVTGVGTPEPTPDQMAAQAMSVGSNECTRALGENSRVTIDGPTSDKVEASVDENEGQSTVTYQFECIGTQAPAQYVDQLCTALEENASAGAFSLEYADVASDGLQALGQIADAGVLGLMSSSSSRTREYAVSLLGKMRPQSQQDVTVILGALQDSDESVRSAAEDAVQDMQEDASQLQGIADQLWRSSDFNTAAFGFLLAGDLGMQGPDVKAAFFSVAHAFPENELIYDVTFARASFGPSDIPNLIALFDSPELGSDWQVDIVEILGAMKAQAQAAIPALARWLTTDPEGVISQHAGLNLLEGEAAALAAIGPGNDASANAAASAALTNLSTFARQNGHSDLLQAIAKAQVQFP